MWSITLMMLLYELAIRVYVLVIRLAAPFNGKASLWVRGRKDWRKRYAPFAAERASAKVLWLHAASLGEFEQGRPILEAFRERFPNWKIVLTFFSPSGFELRKNYPHADFVGYLPADTRQNARDFLDLIRPDAAVFVKYEFWANYLSELQKRGIQTLLVSALFRETQPFFKWYGGLWRKMLQGFAHFFVQDDASGKLLQSVGFQNFTVAGDTRIDRVLKIAESAPENEIVERFVGEAKQVLVLGSSWEADELLVFRAFQLFESLELSKSSQFNLKTIVAPHEPSEGNVARICKLSENALRYSQASGPIPAHFNTMVIDNIGLLNTLYRYGSIAYIGGGFGKGIHNTLEPAAFGLPIIFGPKHQKFEEARQFVARGGAFSVSNSEEFAAVLAKLQDPVFYQKASNAVRDYLETNRGATEKVMAFLETNLKK